MTISLGNLKDGITVFHARDTCGLEVQKNTAAQLFHSWSRSIKNTYPPAVSLASRNTFNAIIMIIAYRLALLSLVVKTLCMMIDRSIEYRDTYASSTVSINASIWTWSDETVLPVCVDNTCRRRDPLSLINSSFQRYGMEVGLVLCHNL